MDLHYVSDGPEEGEVVILSGSLGSDLRMWEPQVGPLVDAGFRVVRHDHRGHGGSPVPPGPYRLDDLGSDAVALLDTLGVARAHWVGLSLGGMLGMWLGVRHPDRIAGLTLCCTSARFEPPEAWSDRARTVTEHGTAAIAEAVVQRWFTPAWRSANPDAVRYYEKMVEATPDAGYAACCNAIEHADLLPVLPEVSAPTLVIAGAEDPASPPEQAERITAGIPGARLAVVETAAHLGNAEQPTTFNSLIVEHLKGAS